MIQCQVLAPEGERRAPRVLIREMQRQWEEGTRVREEASSLGFLGDLCADRQVGPRRLGRPPLRGPSTGQKGHLCF